MRIAGAAGATDGPREYFPAMEFGEPVSFNDRLHIVTYRSAEKWLPRIKVGDVIEIERIHCGAPGRAFAKVTSIDNYPPNPAQQARANMIYPPGTRLVRIFLRVIENCSRDDPRYVKIGRAHV